MVDDALTSVVYVVSDSVGETAEFVVRATASQFDHGRLDLRRVSYVDTEEAVRDVVQKAHNCHAVIVYTLIVPHLRSLLATEAQRLNVRVVDVMGPMMDAFSDTLGIKPKLRPGLLHRLDEDYFRRVEAIEFAVKYDDARDPRGLLRADVVLLGVSRTSKTPLSMYLAHKRVRVANVPLVPEVRPPAELFLVDHAKIVGLTINPNDLNSIRQERLRALGLVPDASYANRERIMEELRYAHDVMEQIGCPIIDVSRRAVEETAGLVLKLIGDERYHSVD